MSTRNWKKRSWLHATAWLLTAMQLHLLLVLVLHHHASRFGSGEAQAKVALPHRYSQPIEGQQSYCTACQILKHSAVRPSLGTPAPDCTLATALVLPGRISRVLSNQPVALTGRSPPLS